MEPNNVLGDIDFFGQIDDLINFPPDDEDKGYCNNLLAGSTVDCNDFPINMADNSLIPADDCEPLLRGGRVDHSMSDVGLLFVPFEDIVKPELPSTFVEDSSSDNPTFQKENLGDYKELRAPQDLRIPQPASTSPISILETSLSNSSSSSSGSNNSCLGEKVKTPLKPYRWGPQHARTKHPRPTNPYNPKPTIHQLVMISPSSSSSSSEIQEQTKEKEKKKKVIKKIETNKSTQEVSPLEHEVARKCLHCEITSTPQWRAGPMGPKTLCNACGVRYKSGRLYPEYRPAASPTFVSSLHSNSHKKVLEMRSKVGHGIEVDTAKDVMTLKIS